jgi:uncharacterized metal-binding protein YceD (DUF177 family)
MIEFPKLRAGANQFEFKVDEKFLSDYEYSPVKQADVYIKLNLFKTENMLDLDFMLSGTANVVCDTCLAAVDMPISLIFKLVIKFSDSENLADDEIIYLNRGEHEYDLKQFLYESLIVAIPSKKSCDEVPEPKPCNKDVLAKIGLVTNVEEAEEESGEKDTDPRWDKLKDIFNNN